MKYMKHCSITKRKTVKIEYFQTELKQAVLFR